MARSEESCVKRVDAAGNQRGAELLGVLDNDGLEGLLSLAEEVGDVQFAGGAALDADGRAVEIGRFGDAERLFHHDALAVIEDDRPEMKAQLEGAGYRLGDARQQNVEFAGLQGGQALLRRGGSEFNLVGRAEHGDRERPAQIDEEALPVAAAVDREETGRGADPDLDHAALLDRVERGAGIGGGDGGTPSQRRGALARGRRTLSA